jgi:hypothetical protein
MGDGHWSEDYYAQQNQARQRSGQSTFAYHDTVSSKPREEQKVHPRLDPKGVSIRESCDSLEHPTSQAVGFLLDVTGSMNTVPETVQKNLPRLHGLIGKIGIPHTQILFGAIGDEFYDRGSLQLGQFETDNRMDEDLEHFWLEGEGGGNGGESYQNGIYFFARHTKIDCWDKRSAKGYLFITGDEYTHKLVRRDSIETLLGYKMEVESIPVEDIIKECQQRYNIFYIIPQHTSHGRDKAIQNDWKKLIGSENVLLLHNEAEICELVATTMGVCEKIVTLEQAKKLLSSSGISDTVSDRITLSLVDLAKSRGVDTGALPAVRRL